MATNVLGRLSNAESLAYLQSAGWTDLTAFTWNLDGTVTVSTSNSSLQSQEITDIVSFITGLNSWAVIS